jgi:hypothetical protein
MQPAEASGKVAERWWVTAHVKRGGSMASRRRNAPNPPYDIPVSAIHQKGEGPSAARQPFARPIRL